MADEVALNEVANQAGPVQGFVSMERIENNFLLGVQCRRPCCGLYRVREGAPELRESPQERFLVGVEDFWTGGLRLGGNNNDLAKTQIRMKLPDPAKRLKNLRDPSRVSRGRLGPPKISFTMRSSFHLVRSRPFLVLQQPN